MMLSVLLIAQIAAQSPDVPALVAAARRARYQQDSSLAEYRTIARQRMSAGIGLSKVFGVGVPGPEKLAARFESVARVGWDHRRGAWGELIGSRGVAPIAGELEPDADEEVSLVLPYHPGNDALWPMTELRGALHDHRDWITHPLDAGSDSLYEFSFGESVNIRLADGSIVRLREIRVRPRRPSERLIVGSLWVDAATGSLVRAAYRPSMPVDLWPLLRNEVDGDEEDVMKKFGPYTGTVREVIIEHGLYEGRFWLPRVRTASGEGTAHGMRITLSIEQTFSYEQVRAVAAGEILNRSPEPVDTTRNGRVRYREWNGDVLEGPCRARGDSSAKWAPDSLAKRSDYQVRYVQGIRFRMFRPCLAADLYNSPSLPGSIYGKGEALFSETDFNRLRSEVYGALAIDRQAKWSPQPAVVTYGWRNGMLRYNRIEGLSAGALIERTLGNGYESELSARIGIADLQPNAQATISRTNVRSDLRATAFRRLAAANEWGDPFGIGPSAVALLFGRDDGLYYRALGAEVGGSFRRTSESSVWSWRLFAEREDSVAVQTNRSFANMISGVDFAPNIQAMTGNYAGASVVSVSSWGSNPGGTRASAVLKLDGATGTASFARLNADLTLTQGLGRRMESTLTGAAGHSVGDVPAQRLWYLGGAQTIRGFSPGAATGDAFWFGRFELARGHPVVRLAAFADAGWAGAREDWSRPGKPLSGIGVGVSMIDGVVRFDVARASTGKFRVDFYFDPR